jgi:hypothetical protein
MKHRVRSFSPDTGKGEWDELFPRALLELRVVVASQLPTRKLFCYLHDVLLASKVHMPASN